MAVTTLRVRARGAALVHNLEAVNASPRRFIGREWVIEDGRHGTRPHGETVEVPNRAEYRACVREGSLWAADAETAAECGVAFDALFGEAAPTPEPVATTSLAASVTGTKAPSIPPEPHHEIVDEAHTELPHS